MLFIPYVLLTLAPTLEPRSRAKDCRTWFWGGSFLPVAESGEFVRFALFRVFLGLGRFDILKLKLPFLFVGDREDD